MQQTSPSEETTALLARLAQRPGVQSTLILARDTGAIVRSSGLVTEEDDVPADSVQQAPTNGVTEGEAKSNKGTRQAEEVARLVYKFVSGCGDMVEGLNGKGDEVKLLRVRTKKSELVIVPDVKYLLVVVHETPPA